MSLRRFRLATLAAASISLVLASCGGGGGSSDSDDGTSALGTQVDAFMTPYLAAKGITAATLTVMKDGAVLYEKAYGYSNLAGTVPLTADALMTGASIVKPVAAAAVQKLAAAGTLALTDKVFCPGVTTPSTANHCWVSGGWVVSSDSRIFDITIEHLISHRGGWDRAGTACYAYQSLSAYPDIQASLDDYGGPCDPQGHEFIVQLIEGIGSPPTLSEDIKFVMKGDLDFTPGTTPSTGDRYSNFGYMLLQHIIETASGVGFNAYVNSVVFTPLGVSSSDFKSGNSRLADADPREPNYVTSLIYPSIYAPGTTVPVRDGAINAGNHLADSTSIMTSRAMATFAGAFKIDTDSNSVDGPTNGVPLSGTTNYGYHYGALPGTATVVGQRTSGVSYAVLMNKNDTFEGPGPRDDYAGDVRVGLEAVLSSAGF